MKIQLKRSNQLAGDQAKAPTAAQMEYGEIAVNYNEQDPVLFIKDRTDQIIRIAGKGAEGGFTGDYNDLINTPTIGDGSITINNADGSENATFTVNQTGDTTVTLPAGFSGDYDDLDNKPGLQEVTDVGNETTNGATFGGPITVDAGVTNENSTYGSGYLIQNRSAGTRNLFTGQLNGTETSTILADGSATFAGNVELGDYSGNNSGVLLYSSGELRSRVAPDSPDAVQTLKIQRGTEDNIILYANGSATFDSSVTAAEFNPGADGAGNFRIDLLPNISTAPKA